MSDEDLLAAVERDHAALCLSVERLCAKGEPWSGAIAEDTKRVGFSIGWFKQERDRRAKDAAERAAEGK